MTYCSGTYRTITLVAAALLAGSSVAQAGLDVGPSEGTTLVAPGPMPGFVERPGVMEFSGRMIARPLPVQALVDRGVAPGEAEARHHTAARILQPWLIEYIQATDEYIFSVPEGAVESAVARQLMSTGDFQYVEPDWIVYPVDCPNDPRFGSQWHHSKIRSCLGWDFHKGDPGIWVAICDTGIDLDHEDLTNNRIKGYNAVDRIREIDGGQVADLNGHGTQTAGTAAAIGNNATGVSGVGQSLSHMTIRVSNVGSGSSTISILTHGARWAIENGASVSSVSYSGVESSSVESTGKAIMDLGGLMVWAAGNGGRRLSGDHQHVIVVGATTSGDGKASFSNTGPMIDCVAPGVDILTTNRSGGYGSTSGTSLSTPMVAAMAALIWSARPTLTPEAVEQLIYDGAIDLGPVGKDDSFGHGRIDSFNTMSAIHTLDLAINPLPLQGGQPVEFIVNGQPDTKTGVFYSLKGPGSSFVIGLGIFVDLNNAKRAGSFRFTDGNGQATWNLMVPTVRRVRDVWFQAAQQSGGISKVIATQVQ